MACRCWYPMVIRDIRNSDPTLALRNPTEPSKHPYPLTILLASIQPVLVCCHFGSKGFWPLFPAQDRLMAHDHISMLNITGKQASLAAVPPHRGGSMWCLV